MTSTTKGVRLFLVNGSRPWVTEKIHFDTIKDHQLKPTHYGFINYSVLFANNETYYDNILSDLLRRAYELNFKSGALMRALLNVGFLYGMPSRMRRQMTPEFVDKVLA